MGDKGIKKDHQREGLTAFIIRNAKEIFNELHGPQTMSKEEQKALFNNEKPKSS